MEDCELFNVCSTEISLVVISISSIIIINVCTWRLVTKVVLNV